MQLEEAIAQYYTDFEGFKTAFKQAVMGRALPGWVWLGVAADGRLLITQTNNEDNPLMHGVVDAQCIPVIGIDLWEHAYLTDYLGDKGAYCDNFLASVDWAIVSQNFEQFNLQGKPAPIGAE